MSTPQIDNSLVARLHRLKTEVQCTGLIDEAIALIESQARDLAFLASMSNGALERSRFASA
jgi:hypothetical protein